MLSDMKKTPTTGRTNKGYLVTATHDFAARGDKYRFNVVSGIVHVDEYVTPCGVWVYLGTLN
jgi:hypothetical protein